MRSLSFYGAMNLVFSLLISNAAFAASYFVSDVHTSVANPELATSVKSLVVSAVANAGGQVADSEGSSDFTLRSELVKLGGAYVLTVTKVKKNGQTYSSRQKAAAVEELDEATDRAVRAAMLSTPTKQDLRVGEVKEREENILRRRILARNATYFGFGPAGLANMGVRQIAYDAALGHIWEVTPNAAIKLMADGVASADLKTYFLMASLGLNSYLLDTESSPYVSANFGFAGSASATTSATTIGGFAGNVGIGYQFFRTSSTQLDLYAGYSTIFGNNTIGAPGAYSLRVGVLF